jgi:hypothetical protein
LPSGSQLAGAASGGSATAAEAAAKARGKLVSALMKRHLVEQVVPVLVELRRLLAEVHSGGGGAVMVWVGVLGGVERAERCRYDRCICQWTMAHGNTHWGSSRWCRRLWKRFLAEDGDRWRRQRGL